MEEGADVGLKALYAQVLILVAPLPGSVRIPPQGAVKWEISSLACPAPCEDGTDRHPGNRTT